MGTIGIPGASAPGIWRYPGLMAACILLAAVLAACGGEAPDAADRILRLEAEIHALEETVERLEGRIAGLESAANAAADAEALKQTQADVVEAQDGIAALAADVAELEILAEAGVVALEEVAAAALEVEEISQSVEEINDSLEGAASEIEGAFGIVEVAFASLDRRLELLEGDPIEKTVRLAEVSGAEAQVIHFGAAYGVGRSAALLLPSPLPEGKIPLIVSLHGFGSDSFIHGSYVSLHHRVNRGGFALLLPNGARNADGNRFWCVGESPCDTPGGEVDDTAALSALVQEAGGEFDMGPVYVFGHSNGGFMSYRLACEGLPALRAVASLAGTSYADADECEAPGPVSVLHIHGTDDAVVRFEGDGEPGATGEDGPGYAGAHDMVRRWGERAGCDWPEAAEPPTTLDLDEYVPGAETQAYRFSSGCADGISIELWVGEGSGHTPGYANAFADALVDWLLAQE